MIAPPRVILITDPRWPVAHIEAVIEAAAPAIARGALLVQLRDKAAHPDALRATATAIVAVTSRVGARFVVNAPHRAALDVARAVGADGAHVPRDAIEDARALLGAAAWISTPAHSDGDALFASRAGATAALVSPIWASPNKGPPRGLAALASAREAVRSSARAQPLLVYALGGVDPASAEHAARAGADGVAVIRALLEAEDPAAVARALDAPFHARRSPD